ncbi:hypothetical protein BSZ39_07715 [Bowdeniella nasicola]|uniref:beta-N-acetylhexosaminidase n=1 Tax=Bowdeniella nasicola TaxID=208480 RepID=A0A1Q5Q268_9ACTO|nr:glycoside hydrolase family 3 protein [Bowdeniella nasicola]OKL53762.1 hypothetical protein BSZ39_07715 [Bowdeniella nasicola]
MRAPDIESWDLKQVVGQLFSVSVGHHADGGYKVADTVETVASLVAERHVGGICYFPAGPDGATPQRIREVVAELQAASEVPLLIAIDQEGGLVTRMREPATRWPSAMAQAAGGDWDAVREIARMSASELRAVGALHPFTPVADVNIEPNNPVIGIRSASSSPHVVADYVRAVIAGIAEAGSASCVKHFPGHGNVAVDSHHGLPVLATSVEDWEAAEAVPFRAAIKAAVDAVMIGHLCMPAVDSSGAPATFSRPIVTDLLRGRLGYDGLVVTDALDMAGAAYPGGPGAACVAALRAGIDQLLMPRDPADCIDTVLAAVRSGELDEAQLRRSAERVVALKAKLAAATLTPAEHDPAAVAAAAIGRSLTWRNPGCTFALSPGAPVTIITDELPPSVGRGVEVVPAALASELMARGHACRITALESSDTSGARILITRDAWRFPEVAAQVSGLEDIACAIAARSPYDAALLADDVPMLLAYGDIPGLAAALAVALTRGEATGQLPVDLPDASGQIRWPRRLEATHD